MPLDFKTYEGAGQLMASQGLPQAVRVGNVVHISGQGAHRLERRS